LHCSSAFRRLWASPDRLKPGLQYPSPPPTSSAR
jgi:hypothetical protein